MGFITAGGKNIIVDYLIFLGGWGGWGGGASSRGIDYLL